MVLVRIQFVNLNSNLLYFIFAVLNASSFSLTQLIQLAFIFTLDSKGEIYLSLEVSNGSWRSFLQSGSDELCKYPIFYTDCKRSLDNSWSSLHCPNWKLSVRNSISHVYILVNMWKWTTGLVALYDSNFEQLNQSWPNYSIMELRTDMFSDFAFFSLCPWKTTW